MATWAELEAATSDLASEARRLLYRTGDGEALLATVRGQDAPRIHPINVGIVAGELYAFVLRSAKLTDLATDGRYALHAHVDPAEPHELMIRGRALGVTDAGVRATVAEAWPFAVDEGYRLFAFDIESVLLGRRDSPDAWPPDYRRWSAA